MTAVLSLPANAAVALDEKQEKIDYRLFASLPEFKQYPPNFSELTANGILKKACTLVHYQGKMTFVLGANQKSRMVAGTRLKKRPQLIEIGQKEAEYKYQKTCPHCNAFKLCSRVCSQQRQPRGVSVGTQTR